MGVEVLDDTNDVGDESFDEETIRSPKADVDARRRLEQRLEDLRLQKELRAYDFDF